MADEEKNKTEEETKEDTEHKFDPDSDACGVAGGCGERSKKQPRRSRSDGDSGIS